VILPSYSPDLNPIEEAFSKVKALVRKEGARLSEALIEAIGRALTAVTLEDAAGWFAHAGYRPQDQPLLVPLSAGLWPFVDGRGRVRSSPQSPK
jgi:uncharacterized protein GlcG (DUF336 family)